MLYMVEVPILLKQHNSHLMVVIKNVMVVQDLSSLNLTLMHMVKKQNLLMVEVF